MIHFIQEWQVLFIPLLILSISQSAKLLLQAAKNDLDWKELNSYGGMPSSHTAVFVSLTTIIGLVEGFDTPLFFITAFVTAVFVRDAVGIRWELGQHGKVLNHIMTTLPEESQKKFPEKLQERLGHTPKEATVGFIIGTVLTVLFFLLLQNI